MTDDYSHDKTSRWNNASELAMKNIGSTCILYKQKHLQSAKFCNIMHTLLTYLGIILGPLAGLLSALSVNNSVGISIISFISGLIVSIIKVGRFEKNALLHNTSSSKYNNLEHNIRRQLCLYRKDRINPVQYCEWVSKSFDDIYKSSPFIQIKNTNPIDLTIQIAQESGSDKELDKEDVKELQIDTDIKISIEDDDDTLSKSPEDILKNTYTDKMMEYEMKRMKL